MVISASKRGISGYCSYINRRLPTTNMYTRTIVTRLTVAIRAGVRLEGRNCEARSQSAEGAKGESLEKSCAPRNDRFLTFFIWSQDELK